MKAEDIEWRIKKFIIKLVKPCKNTIFNGEPQKYEECVKNTYLKHKDTMCKFVNDGFGFWWENSDDYCAFMQTQCQNFLIRLDMYEVAMTSLLGREFEFAPYRKQETESQESYVKRWKDLCQEVKNTFKAKHPEEYEKWYKCKSTHNNKALVDI